MKDLFGIKPVGYFKICDITDGEENKKVLVEKTNAIHNGNMVYALAKQMAGQDTTNQFAFGWFGFGDGGSEISSTGSITYRPTNTTANRNPLSDLYSRVYQKKINDAQGGLTIEVSPVLHPNSVCDIYINVILQQGEPVGQLAMDNASSFSDQFIFDEFGLFSNADNIDNAYLLTHVIFHPIQKSMNRIYQIEYTIRFEII